MQNMNPKSTVIIEKLNDAKEEDVIEIFRSFGKIKSSQFFSESKTALIEYFSEDSAKKAEEKKNGKKLSKKHYKFIITVKRQKKESNFTQFFKNLFGFQKKNYDFIVNSFTSLLNDIEDATYSSLSSSKEVFESIFVNGFDSFDKEDKKDQFWDIVHQIIIEFRKVNEKLDSNRYEEFPLLVAIWIKLNQYTNYLEKEQFNIAKELLLPIIQDLCNIELISKHYPSFNIYNKLSERLEMLINWQIGEKDIFDKELILSLMFMKWLNSKKLTDFSTILQQDGLKEPEKYFTFVEISIDLLNSKFKDKSIVINTIIKNFPNQKPNSLEILNKLIILMKQYLNEKELQTLISRLIDWIGTLRDNELRNMKDSTHILNVVNFLMDNIDDIAKFRQVLSKFLSAGIDFRRIQEESLHKEKLNLCFINFTNSYYMKLEYLLLIPKSDTSKEYLEQNISNWKVKQLSLHSLAKILDDFYENEELTLEYTMKILKEIVKKTLNLKDALYLLLYCKSFGSSVKLPEVMTTFELPYIDNKFYGNIDKTLEDDELFNSEYKYLAEKNELPNLYGLICFAIARFVCSSSKYDNHTLRLLQKDVNSLYTSFISLFKLIDWIDNIEHTIPSEYYSYLFKKLRSLLSHFELPQKENSIVTWLYGELSKYNEQVKGKLMMYQNINFKNLKKSLFDLYYQNRNQIIKILSLFELDPDKFNNTICKGYEEKCRILSRYYELNSLHEWMDKMRFNIDNHISNINDIESYYEVSIMNQSFWQSLLDLGFDSKNLILATQCVMKSKGLFTHITLLLSRDYNSINSKEFDIIMSETEQFLTNLSKGTIHISNISTLRNIWASNEENWNHDLKELFNIYYLEGDPEDIQKCISIQVELEEYYKSIENLIKFLKVYDIELVNNVYDIINMLKDGSNLLLKDAEKNMKDLKSVIGETEHTILLHMETLSKTKELVDFCSQQDFDTKIIVVRGQTQGVEYNKKLLDNLIIVYNTVKQLLKYFSTTSKKTTLSELCRVLKEDCLGNTDKLYVTDIHLLFKDVQEKLPTLQSLFTSNSSLDALMTITLTYFTKSKLILRSLYHKEGYGISLEFKNEDRDEELTHIDGSILESVINGAKVFMDHSKNKITDEKIVKFNRFFEEVLDLLKVYQRLVDSGYPGCQHDVIIINRDFNEIEVNSLINIKNEMVELMENWIEFIERVSNKYPRLHLLDVKQICQVIHLLKRNNERLSIQLIPYIKLCFPDIVYVNEKMISMAHIMKYNNLSKHLKDNLNEKNYEELTEIFGKLLESIYNDNQYEQVHDKKFGIPIVHKTIEFTPWDLFKLKVRLCNYMIPHPTQILWCSPKTSSAELDKFRNRVESIDYQDYFIFEVNKLNPEVRQKLVEWTNSLVTITEGKNYGNLHLIFTEQTGIDLFTFLKIEDETASKEGIGIKKEEILKQNNISSLNIYYDDNDNSTGKSTYIHHLLDSVHESKKIFMHIDESFDALNLFKSEFERVQGNNELDELHMFLKISAYAPLNILSRMLYEMLYWGNISSYDRGECISLLRDIKHHIYVEINTPPNNDKGYEHISTSALFKNQLPSLQHLAKKESHTISLFIDNKAKYIANLIHQFKCNKNFRPELMNNIPEIDNDNARSILEEFFKSNNIKNLRQKSRFISLLFDSLTIMCESRKFLSTLSSYELTNDVIRLINDTGPIFNILVKEAICLSHNNGKIPSDLILSGKNISPNLISLSLFSLNKSSHNLPIEVTTLTTCSLELLRASLAYGLNIENTHHMSNLVKLQNYVLTPDFASKILILHSRFRTSTNTILVGDTGRGKTELLNFYSLILNTNSKHIPDVLSILEQELFVKHKFSYIDDIKTSIDFHLNNPLTFSKMCNALISIAKTLISQYSLIKLTPTLKLIKDGNFKSYSKNSIKDLVNSLLNMKFNTFFHILMHQNMSSETIKLKLKEAIDFTRQTNIKTVLFIDEFNTTKYMGIMKEIFVDRTFNGHKIPENLFIVGAINPPRISSKSKLNKIREYNFTGIGKSILKEQSRFSVRPIHKSMEELILDFPDLTEDQGKFFLTSLLEGLEYLTLNQKKVMIDSIIMAHKFVTNANIKNMNPSIRDFMRTIKVFRYFFTTRAGAFLLGVKPLNECLDINFEIVSRDNQYFLKSLYIAIAMNYFFRLEFVEADISPQEYSEYNLKAIISEEDFYSRQSFLLFMKENVKSFVVSDFVKCLYSQDEKDKGALVLLYDNTEIPQGIAKTIAIMENLFCIVTCIDMKIPLMICGPAGCSKTLSFTIAVQNMKGRHSVGNDVYKLFCQVHPHRYQCSEKSTDKEVKSIYKSSIELQEVLMKDSEDREFEYKDMSCVFLDEAGLPDEEEQSLKVLHYMLDHPKVASIILTNKWLDPAKTNRALQLLQSTPSKNDLYNLAEGTICSGEKVPKKVELILHGLVNAYSLVMMEKYSIPYHLRDFVYFLRYLNKCNNSQNRSLNEVNILRGLMRNFNGVKKEEFKRILETFIYEINSSLKRENYDPFPIPDIISPIEIFKESLNDKLVNGEDPNTSSFRYICLLDPTDVSSGIDLLFAMKLCDRETTRIISASDFEGDLTDTEHNGLILQLKRSMTIGETVILVSCQGIYGSFYDVFNKHFTILQNEDKNDPNKFVFYANVAVGSISRPCIVHPDFRVIVHIPLSELCNTPTPFLNRFEKYQLSIKDCLKEMLQIKGLGNKITKDGMDLVDVVLNSSQNLINYFKRVEVGIDFDEEVLKTLSCNTIYGLIDEETVSSLLLSSLTQDDCLSINNPLHVNTTNYEDSTLVIDLERIDANCVEELIDRINYHLLQLVRPEYIYRATYLPKKYIDEYILRQEHFNLSSMIKYVYENRITKFNKYIIYTRSTGELISLHTRNQKENLKVLLNNDLFDIISLSEIKYDYQCEELLKKFSISKKKMIIISVDMESCSKIQLNIVKEYINKYIRTQLAILIIHFSPEVGLRSEHVYHSIFLNGWDIWYIDSLTLSESISGNSQFIESDIRPIVGKSFGLDILFDSERIFSMFKERFSEEIKNILPLITLTRPRQCFPVKPAHFNKRYLVPTIKQEIKSFLEECDIVRNLIIQRFTDLWTKETLYELIDEICVSIFHGYSTSSFLAILRNSLSCLLKEVLKNLILAIGSNFNFETIQSINFSDVGNLYVKIFKNMLLIIPLPSTEEIFELNRDIESSRFINSGISSFNLRFEQAWIPCIPLYDLLEKQTLNLIDRILLKENDSRNPKIICESLVDEIKSNHPILYETFELIESNNELLNSFIHDFIYITMKLPKLSEVLSNMVEDVFRKMTSINNEFMDSISLPRWFVLYTQSDLLHYFATCIVPLEELQLKIDNFEKFQPPTSINDTKSCEKYVFESAIKILWKTLVNNIEDENIIERWALSFRSFQCRVTCFDELAEILQDQEILSHFNIMFALFMIIRHTSISITKFSSIIAKKEKLLYHHATSDFIINLKSTINFIELLMEDETFATLNVIKEDITIFFMKFSDKKSFISDNKEENIKYVIDQCQKDLSSEDNSSYLWYFSIFIDWLNGFPQYGKKLFSNYVDSKLDSIYKISLIDIPNQYQNAPFQTFIYDVYIHYYKMKFENRSIQNLLDLIKRKNKRNLDMIKFAAKLNTLITKIAEALSSSDEREEIETILQSKSFLDAFESNFIEGSKEFLLLNIKPEASLIKFLSNKKILIKLDMLDKYIPDDNELQFDLFKIPLVLRKNHKHFKLMEKIEVLLSNSPTEENINTFDNFIYDSLNCNDNHMVYNLRMYLVILCYYNYFDQNKQCLLLKHILEKRTKSFNLLNFTESERNILLFLSNGPLNEPFETQCELNDVFSSSARIKENLKVERQYSHLMVNILAITLGSPGVNNFMYTHIFSPSTLNNLYGPGSLHGRKNYDCGFKTEKGELHPDSSHPILEENPIYRRVSNSMYWLSLSLCYYANQAEARKGFKNYHFLNYSGTTDAAYMNYIYQRGFTFFQDLHTFTDMIPRGMHPGHYFNEFLLLYRKALLFNKSKKFKQPLRSANEAIEYEEAMLEVFKDLDRKYFTLRNKIRDEHLKLKDNVINILNGQTSLSKEFRYKLPRESDLFSHIYQLNNNELMKKLEFVKKFLSKRRSLACIRYIPTLVYFFTCIQNTFRNRITESDAHSLTVHQAIELLRNIDSSEYEHLVKLWEKIKMIWSKILDLSLMMDRQCGNQLENELHIPILDDETLFFMLLQQKHEIDRPSIIVRLIKNLTDIQKGFVLDRNELEYKHFNTTRSFEDLSINSHFKTDISWLRHDSKLSISLMIGDIDPNRYEEENYFSAFYFFLLSQFKVDKNFSLESIHLDIERVLEYIIHSYTSNATELISNLEKYNFEYKNTNRDTILIDKMLNPIKILSQKIKKLEGDSINFEIKPDENLETIEVINILNKLVDIVEENKLDKNYCIIDLDIFKELSYNNSYRKILCKLKVKHLKAFSLNMIKILEEKKFMFVNPSYLPYISPLPQEVQEIFENFENILSNNSDCFYLLVNMEKLYTHLSKRDLLKELSKYKLSTPLIEIVRQKGNSDEEKLYHELGLDRTSIEHYTTYIRQLRKTISTSISNRYIKEGRKSKLYIEKEFSLLI